MNEKMPTSSPPFSASTFTNTNIQTQPSISPNQVSRIVNAEFKQGEVVKGKSRINYIPYEKKVIEYEERQYVEKVPVKRKVIEYQERKVIEEVPREVIATDYYAVQNIKQYYKQVIPEKKVEMVPVQRKVKKIQYVPVEKQIIHYPEGQNLQEAKGKSRMVLEQQGFNVRGDAQFQPIDPRLLYQYTTKSSNGNNPIGYVEDGNHRFLSTSPSFQERSNYYGIPYGESAVFHGNSQNHTYQERKPFDGYF